MMSINPLNWLNKSLKIELHARWSNFSAIEYFLMKISEYSADDLNRVLAKFHENWLRIENRRKTCDTSQSDGEYNQNRNMPHRYKQSSQHEGDNTTNTVPSLTLLMQQNTYL